MASLDRELRWGEGAMGHHMDIDDIEARLKYEWIGPGGFLYGIRSGRLEAAEVERFLAVLEAVDPTDPRRFEPRILGRLWSIPFYMLSHIQNSERLGLDTREQRRVMWRAIEILGGIVGGRTSRLNQDEGSGATRSPSTGQE